MGNLYELQAGTIERTCIAHGLAVRVWQATVTPRIVRYDVTTALGMKIGRLQGLDGELAMALAVPTVRISRDAGVIHVEVPRETPRLVDMANINGRLAGHIPETTALLGVDDGGSPLLLRLDSPDVAHVLIAGTTGSGKTELLRTMLASLVQRNRAGRLQLVLVDPKNAPLRPFAELPHCQALASSAQEAAGVLEACVAVMTARKPGTLPHVVIAIDELAELVMDDPRIVNALTRLTQRGREANIHVLAATQRPSAALVGGMVKANFPTRIVGAVASADDARVAAGISGTLAERLAGRGDFLLLCKGTIIRFQVAYTSPEALTQIVDGIGRRPRAENGVGMGMGLQTPAALLTGIEAGADPHPTPPQSARMTEIIPFRPRSLRSRFSFVELCGFLNAAGGRLTEAAEAAFGYSDSATLAILREAQEAQRRQPTKEVEQ